MIMFFVMAIEIVKYITRTGGIVGFMMAIGAIIGCVMFITYLESKKMGNIIFRDGLFSLSNVFQYLKNPLKTWHLWHPSLLRANWIFMVSAGIFIGFVVGSLLKVCLFLL